MAQRRSDLQALYPQRKPLDSSSSSAKFSGGVGNGKDSKKQEAAIPSTKIGADLADPAPPTSLSLYAEAYDEEDDVEQLLRQFDVDMRYGPCLGLTRMERWQRAAELGLTPCQHVKDILEKAGGIPNCLWEGHV